MGRVGKRGSGEAEARKWTVTVAGIKFYNSDSRALVRKCWDLSLGRVYGHKFQDHVHQRLPPSACSCHTFTAITIDNSKYRSLVTTPFKLWSGPLLIHYCHINRDFIVFVTPAGTFRTDNSLRHKICIPLPNLVWESCSPTLKRLFVVLYTYCSRTKFMGQYS